MTLFKGRICYNTLMYCDATFVAQIERGVMYLVVDTCQVDHFVGKKFYRVSTNGVHQSVEANLGYAFDVEEDTIRQDYESGKEDAKGDGFDDFEYEYDEYESSPYNGDDCSDPEFYED